MAVLNTRDNLNNKLDNETAHMELGNKQSQAKNERIVKEILKDGTPDWVTHPEDYKSLAQEDYCQAKENSDRQVNEYKMPGQDVLSDRDTSMVNGMSLKSFLDKLRNNGLRAWSVESPLHNGTGGLWVMVPSTEGLRPEFVTTIQYPAMYEWSVMSLDAHGLPAGEKYIGWRNAVAQLIMKGIWSEDKAHRVFGSPSVSVRASRYRQNLWNYRNNRIGA